MVRQIFYIVALCIVSCNDDKVCCGFVPIKTSQSYLGSDLPEQLIVYMQSKGMNPDTYYVGPGSKSISDTVTISLWPEGIVKNLKAEDGKEDIKYEEFIFFDKDPFLEIYYDSLTGEIFGHRSGDQKSH